MNIITTTLVFILDLFLKFLSVVFTFDGLVLIGLFILICLLFGIIGKLDSINFTLESMRESLDRLKEMKEDKEFEREYGSDSMGCENDTFGDDYKEEFEAFVESICKKKSKKC